MAVAVDVKSGVRRNAVSMLAALRFQDGFGSRRESSSPTIVAKGDVLDLT